MYAYKRIHLEYFCIELDLETYVSAPEIFSHPTDLKITAPSNAVFTCSASACDDLTFEWKRMNSNLPKKSLLSQNGTKSILSIPNVTSDDVGEYYCVVLANNKTSQSKTARLQFLGIL